MKYFSALGGKILAEKKARQDAERNRRRLDEAALVSRELGTQRIADGEIKKLVARLVYEADGYIVAARESEGAFYEPLVLDALDTARAAVNAWKKNENEVAVGKYLSLKGMRGGTEGSEGIVIPKDDNPNEPGQPAGSEVTREKTMEVLWESLRLFTIQNSIRSAGDIDAAIVGLESEKTP